MAIFPEYESFDGLGLANLIKTGVLAPEELLQAAIERIDSRNPTLNAVIHKLYEQARAAIKKDIPSGPFEGVPFLLKDLLVDFAGAPLQHGSRMSQGWISPQDSELVKRIKTAGLIVLGKTNTPEFGLGPVTEPFLFGPTHNPWDLKRSPGGSSGGSAAAVAAGMVPMAHGGDGGGSIRIPSAYCGVFGFKPSRGRTPVGPKAMRVWQGMVVDHVITRSVRDSAAMLDVLSGPELGSPIALEKPDTTFLDSLENSCRPLRIAVTDHPFFPAFVDPQYKQAVKDAGAICERMGHSVDTAFPRFDHDEVMTAYMIVIAADTAAGVSLLAKEMQRSEDYTLLETTTAIVCEVGKHFSASDFAWASHTLDMAGLKFAEFFQRYDVLLTPTMASPPPLIGSLQPTPIEKNILELLRRVPYGPLLRKITKQIARKNLAFLPFTPLFNITGQPAMSVPLFWDKAGLPIGIQFATRFGEDALLLQLAKQLEEAQPWNLKRPSHYGLKEQARELL